MFLCGSRAQEECLVKLSIVDSSSGRALSGLVRIKDAEGKVIRPAQLMSRGMGLKDGEPLLDWSVLPKATTVELPHRKLTVEAIGGLETEASKISIDLTGKSKADVRLSLLTFHNPREAGWRSANTHLHLMKISRDDCDRYLQEIPKADGLDMVFLSYLERAVADREYTSNRYTDDDLDGLTKASGVVFGNGEEHRHNFAGFGQGYGHVMLLDIQKLIQPVSIGPGIMKEGTDGLPLRRGIETARRDGAKVIWCHNNWGMESLPSWLDKKIHAQNIFDGGTHGSFKDSFYRYLNLGLHVPFSTGTDWFMYDFSRVYVQMEEPLTVKNWLNGLAAGRNYITNGPLLELTVNGKDIGSTIRMTKSGELQVNASGAGRLDFRELQVVVNGKVVKRQSTQKVGGHFEAKLQFKLLVDEPVWLALRTPPPMVKDDPELQTRGTLNEAGRELFGHTSPIYVNVDGSGVWDQTTAKQILAEMQANHKAIVENGKFEDAQAKARVLDVHGTAIDTLKARIEQD
ncbi:MAG: hypothetical protein CMJ78_24575 [Planctomycetaceae bacterium]|nr:hypothetical protein [Planctomycetaceae bacterium]